MQLKLTCGTMPLPDRPGGPDRQLWNEVQEYRHRLVVERQPTDVCHVRRKWAGGRWVTWYGDPCATHGDDTHCQHRAVPVNDERLAADQELA